MKVMEVYYESIKREPKIRGIKKCRCDERLQTKTKEFTRLPYTVDYYCSLRETFPFYHRRINKQYKRTIKVIEEEQKTLESCLDDGSVDSTCGSG
jgi:hypothetical protein